ncbi:hypothetical protein [Lysobacter sp. D1-1-M9]
MVIWLLDEGRTEALQVPVSDLISEALDAQWRRATSEEMHDQLIARLASCVGAGVELALDPDLRSPTKRQVDFAATVARSLCLSLPADALRFRGAMSAFLDRHADGFQQCQAKAKAIFLGPMSKP